MASQPPPEEGSLQPRMSFRDAKQQQQKAEQTTNAGASSMKPRESSLQQQSSSNDDDSSRQADDEKGEFSHKHPLEYTWTMYYDPPTNNNVRRQGREQTKQWQSNTKKIMSFRFVEDFWRFVHHPTLQFLPC